MASRGGGEEATSNKCHATRNKCLTSSNKKLLETIVDTLLLLVRHLFLTGSCYY